MGEINNKVIEQTFGELAKDIIGDLEVIAEKMGRHGLDRSQLLSICLNGEGYINVSPHQYPGASACRIKKGSSLRLEITDIKVLTPEEPKGEENADI